MGRTYSSLKKALADAEVIMNSDTTVKVIFSKPIMFAYNSAQIDSSTFPSFRSLAKVLLKQQNTDIIISGHTDSIGGNNFENRNLSVRRADSAKNLLIFNKVAPGRIKTWGFGAKEPIATNATESGRSRNRRIEMVVMYKLHLNKND